LSTPVESEVVERTDGGYAWVDVLEIKPAAQKTYDEVKDDVLTAWREQEANTELRKKTDALVDRINKGETIAALAKEAGLELTTTQMFKRTDSPQGVPRTVVAQSFTLPRGGLSSAPAANATDRIVFEVADVQAAKPLEGDARQQRVAQLKQNRQADVLREYIAGLRRAYEVSIDERAVERALGLDQQ
ncbi:MAG: hypothetical protein AAFY64_02185, partial [Pseudomonadota bacterium]